MVFSSPIFIFCFLPIVCIIYYFIDKRFRNGLLLIASLIFYSWSGLAYTIIIIASTIANYFIGYGIAKFRNKGKIIVVIGIFFNLSLLGFFKYFNFFIDNIEMVIQVFDSNFYFQEPIIPLPIGISFFTFQIMSYIIDVYLEKVKVQKNVLHLGLYIMFFPQLIAGPIVRYIDIQEQIEKRKIDLNKLEDGIKRFIIGLFKKMIIANNVGYVASLVFDNPDNIYTVSAWIAIFCYSLQIYFDFSAYSDMAIGLGKLFGFEFKENFNYPYVSKSIKEFWSRWHISLSSWFKEYLYIPLGGNRKGRIRMYINQMIVFFITGLWHGASWNFVVWGIYHGFFLTIEKAWFSKIRVKVPKFIKHIYVLIVVQVGWVFFRSNSLPMALDFIKNMFLYSPGDIRYLLLDISNEAIISVIIGVVLTMPIFKLGKKIKKTLFLSLIVDAIYIMIFATSILKMATAQFNPFIYFRF